MIYGVPFCLEVLELRDIIPGKKKHEKKPKQSFAGTGSLQRTKMKKVKDATGQFHL